MAACACGATEHDWCADCGQAVCEACWDAGHCAPTHQPATASAAGTTNPSPRETAGNQETTMSKTTLKSMTKAQLTAAIRAHDPGAVVGSKSTKADLLKLLKKLRRKAAKATPTKQTDAEKAKAMLDKATKGRPFTPSAKSTKAQLTEFLLSEGTYQADSDLITKGTKADLLSAAKSVASGDHQAPADLEQPAIAPGPSSRLPDLLDGDTMAVKAAQQKADDEAARKAPAATKAQRNPLTITEPVNVTLRHGGNTHSGILNFDGSLEVSGTLYRTPSAAGRAIRGQETNGYLHWTFQDGDERKPIDALRQDPKGYGTGQRQRPPRSPQSLANKVATKRDQVRRTRERLTRQEEQLAKLEQALAEAKAAQGEADDAQADQEGDPIPQTLTEPEPKAEVVLYEADALGGMKVGPLRKLAKSLAADEAVPAKKADLVAYVLRHQGEGVPA